MMLGAELFKIKDKNICLGFHNIYYPQQNVILFSDINIRSIVELKMDF